MKIELQLTAAQIVFLSVLINKFVDDYRKQFVRMPRKEKAAYTIALDVADRLHTKSRSVERSLKQKKLFKMTFKYYEAHGINYFISTLKDNPGNDTYFDTMVLNIHGQLDQKLQ